MRRPFVGGCCCCQESPTHIASVGTRAQIKRNDVESGSSNGTGTRDGGEGSHLENSYLGTGREWCVLGPAGYSIR